MFFYHNTILQFDAIRTEQFFYGDVVLFRVNMALRDEENVVDQIYEKKIYSDFHDKDFFLLLKKAYI